MDEKETCLELNEADLEKKKRFAEAEIIGTVRNMVREVERCSCRDNVFTEAIQANLFYTAGLLTGKVEKLEEIEHELEKLRGI